MLLPARTLQYLSSATPQGQRNAELFQAALQMRDAGAGQAHAFNELLDKARRDGLSEEEARKTVSSAYAKEARMPLQERPKQQQGLAQVGKARFRRELPRVRYKLDNAL